MKLTTFLAGMVLAALIWAVVLMIAAWSLGLPLPFFKAWALGFVLLFLTNLFTGNVRRAYQKHSLWWASLRT